MKTNYDEVTWTRRTKVLAIGLAVVLAFTLGAAIMALNPQLAPGPTQATGQATASSTNGQAPVDESGQQAVGEVFNRTELYFGSEKPDGSEVTEEEFETFVDDEATPSFPDGLTALTGDGQFRDSSGEIVEERSYVLILLYPPDDEEANGEIEEIREDYKTEFGQESVLRADSREQVSF